MCDKPQIISNKLSGIYIHVPFCRKKCLYCDFFSGGEKNIDWEAFTDSVINEFKIRKDILQGYYSTLYIGGGTPSLMPPAFFELLTNEIFRISGRKCKWDEFTLEVNPEDVTEENCAVWRGCGVSRISMGIQSLNDNELKLSGRGHDAKTALLSLDLLQKHFDNVTIDLIFGLPGQSVLSWRDTVDIIISRRPQHISAYSLMFEDGTVMTKLREQGRLSFPDEEECINMWKILIDKLNQAGYQQYELSNYCLPGFESVHNKRYWLGNPYIGLGPSAHSYDGGRVRRANKKDIKMYISVYSVISKEGPEPTCMFTEEKLSESELIDEKIMLSLRQNSGLDLKDVENRFGHDVSQKIREAALEDIRCGNLLYEDSVLRLSQDAVMKSDDIIVRLLP